MRARQMAGKLKNFKEKRAAKEEAKIGLAV